MLILELIRYEKKRQKLGKAGQRFFKFSSCFLIFVFFVLFFDISSIFSSFLLFFKKLKSEVLLLLLPKDLFQKNQAFFHFYFFTFFFNFNLIKFLSLFMYQTHHCSRIFEKKNQSLILKTCKKSKNKNVK